MKSVLNNGCCKVERPFPKLMKSRTSGVIVLFLKPCVGTVVNGSCNYQRTTGCYFNQWDMNYFHDYEGSVTLCND